jgi:PKD repeat protein
MWSRIENMTYSRIIRHLLFLLFISFSLHSSVLAQGTAGLDCADALRLCNTSSRNDTIKFPPPHPIGLVDDLVNGDSVSWLSGEERPFWYTFTVQNTGPFEMVIDDNVSFAGVITSFAYANNWAIFDITAGCGTIGLATEIAGIDNKSTNNAGPTGIIFNPPANGRFIAPITLTAGRTYALIIDMNIDVTAGFDIFNSIDFNPTGLAGAVNFSPLSADFSVSNDTVCTGQVITFTDQTTNGNPPFIYDWDFGDGSGTSTVANPTYSYTTNGTYVVTQTVDVDTFGLCTDVATQTIVVQDISVTLNPVPDLCDNDAPVTLTGNPAGGTFSGPGVSGNTFDPSVTGTGSFLITYR